MKKTIIILCIIILIGGLSASVFYGISVYNKIGNLQDNLFQTHVLNKKLTEENEELLKKSTPIDLRYNNSTGELFPIFNDAMNPHTCVWTILGDHGSDSIVITREGITYNMDSYDYVGHLLSNSIEIIKVNKFLPPRLPIYVTCVDWENKNYHGTIGEYK